MTHCTCRHQLQPHDYMPGVCSGLWRAAQAGALHPGNKVTITVKDGKIVDWEPYLDGLEDDPRVTHESAHVEEDMR